MKNSLTLIATILFLSLTQNSQAATYSIFSPLVEEGEIAAELRYSNLLQADPAEKGSQAMALALEWGFNKNWRLEVVTEYETPKSMPTVHEAYEVEFVRNLSEQGEKGYSYSSAFVIGVGLPSETTRPNTLEYGLYIEKGFGHKAKSSNSEENNHPYSFLANIKLEDQEGTNAESGVELNYAMQFKSNFSDDMQAGLEFYGGLGTLGGTSSFDTQVHVAGPVLFGEFELGEDSALAYQIGYLFGLSKLAADGTLKINLAYEF